MQPNIIYRSKIGGVVLFTFVLGLGGLAVVYAINELWQALTIDIIVALFIIYMFLTTHYTITNTDLLVRSGYLVNRTIAIASITKIVNTNSVLSAPALSLDRIEVFYNKYDSIVISPQNKATFIEALKAVNSKIEA